MVKIGEIVTFISIFYNIPVPDQIIRNQNDKGLIYLPS